MVAEERAAFLQRIIAIARNIKKATVTKGGLSEDDLVALNSHAAFEVPAHFFSPLDIKNDLLQLGLSSDAVDLLSPAVSSLTGVYHRAFQRLSAAPRYPGMPAVHDIMENLAEFFRQTYQKEVLPVLKERILALLHARDENRFVEVDDGEPSFNAVSVLLSFRICPYITQQYTPFLLQYFEFNAYPSLADRELLAKKSGMTPRQIEVWASLSSLLWPTP